jgi:hypothetical protein
MISTPAHGFGSGDPNRRLWQSRLRHRLMAVASHQPPGRARPVRRRLWCSFANPSPGAPDRPSPICDGRGNGDAPCRLSTDLCHYAKELTTRSTRPTWVRGLCLEWCSAAGATSPQTTGELPPTLQGPLGCRSVRHRRTGSSDGGQGIGCVPWRMAPLHHYGLL